MWIALVVYIALVMVLVLVFNPLGGVLDRWDTIRLRWIATLRPGQFTLSGSR